MTDTHSRIRVIDSHTGGEPTRVVISGGPDLGSGSMAERLARFKAEHDHFRSAIVNEPRGSDAIVGALLCEPVEKPSSAGVIFFNNVGYIGMCGHGTIGLIVTLAHLGRVKTGVHRIETPVGVVTAELHANGEVTVNNVPSYRYAKDVAVEVEGHGTVVGDVAWGGNWFFLINHDQPNLELKDVDALTEFTWRIRQSLENSGITGANGLPIDHIELFVKPGQGRADSRNFVLCPGKSYDRSPCGTGTSAKMACLYADGKLRAGDVWRQESIVGSVFEGSVTVADDKILPHIKGSAHINAEIELVLNERDPFCWGIRR